MSITRTLRGMGCAVATGALLFTSAPTASADQVRDDQWPLQAYKAEEIWDVATGKGVTVAVIDDGVLSQHQDLKGNMLEGKDFIDNDASAEPEGGDEHGTGMAGLIAAHGHGSGGADGAKGLAPAAKILPIRDNGLTAQGFGPSIRYAVDQGASIINISQVGNTVQPEVELSAIKHALDNGVLVVAGTGNDGRGPDFEAYPAQFPGVVAVSGVTRAGAFWEDSNRGPHVLLSAPAEHVVSTGGESTSDYQMGSGTSDSTAYVSAALALLKEKFPDLTPGQLVNRLVKTAGLPSAAQGLSLPDEKYGYGFIQPLAALNNDIPAGSENGPLKVPEVSASGDPSAAPDNNAPAPDANASAESEGDDGGSMMPIVLGVLGVLVVVVVVVIVVARKKRNGGPPPPSSGGPGGWGPGVAGPPAQRPGNYGNYGNYQPPQSPGSYPPPPPSQPRGR